MIQLPRLYAVADAAFGEPVYLAQILFDAGAELVQVRHKTASARMLLEEVDAVLKLAPPNAQTIVNDRADVARLSGATGVHLGQDDLPPSQARRILSDRQWIGFSTHTLEQALEADQAPVDYIAVGPVFATSTKENAAPVLGLDRLREICSRVRKPVVAIGGITLESANDVLNCGAASVAVIRDLVGYANIADRVRKWVRHLES
jgi:thiamine-phosphate pyrophosphorylase